MIILIKFYYLQVKFSSYYTNQRSLNNYLFETKNIAINTAKSAEMKQAPNRLFQKTD